jgi:hypothetical protein
VRRNVKGSFMMTIGYLLSPFSWWNDPFVNIPLAYGIAFLCGLISPRLFSPAMVAGYWLTNVTGLVLLHRGAASFRAPAAGRSKRSMAIANGVVLAAYTAIILVLMRYGVLRFPKKGISP